MLQRAALLIAVVLSLVACAGAAAPAVPTTSARPAVDRADALVADLIARRYEAVVGRFDDAMRVAVPVERNR